ncbi:MAG: hypothetical protein V7L20_07820 [Nostoc sp.]|uniref:hypothetical protein n=1 Tax=Nostoc sp. TaxID=1180 RepID=UPI002FFAE8E5
MSNNPIYLAALYTGARMNQTHKSLFGSSNPATPTQKLEQETQRRSEQLAEEDERKLHQYEMIQHSMHLAALYAVLYTEKRMNQPHKSLFGSSHSLFS